MLRLRANVFWPAMHGCSVPFFLTEGNREMAEKFGIFIGTSHCEPMLRNTNGEWGRAGVGDYNYVTNKKNVYQFWEDRVKETVHTNGFYTLGMRGVHDTGMVGAETMDQQRATLQQIIHDQRGLLKKYVNEDVTKVPQVFIPYKEVLPIYKSGLEVPEDVTLMWCDDNYGYIRHLPTEKERIRKGGNGIYYHFSYLGRPQTQLWLPSTCPSLAQTELERAYRHGIQKLWVFNAGDIKPNEFLIEYGLDMAWDRDILMNRNSGEYMAKWLEREFGEELGKDLVYVWKEYYDLTYQCRAEFLGHTRIEEQDPRYKVISDLPWSDKKVKSYLDKAVKMEEEMLQLREKVKKEDKAHWFEFVEYPCSSLAAMARKMLVSQLARHGKMAWDEAVEGQKKIWSLTEEYHTLLDGKWNHMMGLWKWHRLFDEVDTTRSSLPVMVPEDKNDYILTAKNGKMGSESYIIEGLGYSNCALALKKDDTFSIDIPSSADSLDIMFAFVPNHPVDSDRLEVRVEIEGEKAQYIRYETQGRSEEWKQNIERNQALRSIKIPASSHKRAMKLTATTPAVVLDEIIITE